MTIPTQNERRARLLGFQADPGLTEYIEWTDCLTPMASAPAKKCGRRLMTPLQGFACRPKGCGGGGMKKQLGYIRSMSRVNGITDMEPFLISRDDALEHLKILNRNPYVYHWWSPAKP